MSEALATKYQQKTDKEHILSNPDTYIGSVEQIKSELWILHDQENKIIEKNEGGVCLFWFAKLVY